MAKTNTVIDAPVVPAPAVDAEAPVVLVSDATTATLEASAAETKGEDTPAIIQPWAQTAPPPAPFPAEALTSDVKEETTPEPTETTIIEEIPAPAVDAEAPVVLDDKVIVIIPHNFTLTIAHGTEINFSKGVGKMTQDELNHWWTIANGVTRYEE